MGLTEHDIMAMAGVDKMHRYFLGLLGEEASEPPGEFLRLTKELLPYAPGEYQDVFLEAFRDAWQGFEPCPTRFSSSGFSVPE